jgi:ribosome maturation factor RimP
MQASSRHRPPRPAPAPPSAAPDPGQLASLLAPVVTGMGMDLEGVRITSAGRRRRLRVTVDADGGISLDDIALVSRALSAELDATGAMGDSPYTLEVSSPGVDRPLTEPRHWRRAAGRLVSVPLQAQPPGSPAIEGRVAEAGEHMVTLESAGRTRAYRYDELGPGSLQVEFGRVPAAFDRAGDGVPGQHSGEDAGEDEPDGY